MYNNCLVFMYLDFLKHIHALFINVEKKHPVITPPLLTKCCICLNDDRARLEPGGKRARTDRTFVSNLEKRENSNETLEPRESMSG